MVSAAIFNSLHHEYLMNLNEKVYVQHASTLSGQGCQQDVTGVFGPLGWELAKVGPFQLGPVRDKGLLVHS
jgi:hypothetical protein